VTFAVEKTRLLNMANIIAITQIRIYAPARGYYTRRRADGKTRREALRALKRHLARKLFQILTVGPQSASLAAAPSAARRPSAA
jgi:hypothetical protein